VTGIVGFVGLGNMGSALAANLVAAGLDVATHDVAGAERSPAGAAFTDHLTKLAQQADVIVLSLPDGKVSEQVCAELAAVDDRRVRYVLDTSTVGPTASQTIEALLVEAGISYLDAPVSGGVGGARARTLMVMYAGTDEACAGCETVLAGLSDRSRRVGERAGLAQALKLANNYLAAVALAATSEAVAFGVGAGLSMETMLDVLNSSSGQSGATADKFPKHVLTGTYSAGFANTLMAKDVRLYLAEVARSRVPAVLADLTGSVWNAFAEAEPGADFTRIYPYLTELAPK
jgi:3-hydroxyisobutyrate dehydrogenase-like beta-hydroxyacid dehydrogenase